MPVTVDWYNPEKTILCYTFDVQWTWDDIQNVLEIAFSLIDSVDHPIHVLLDLRANTSPPRISAAGLRQVAHSPATHHPNVTRIIIIGGGPMIRVLYDIFSRIYPQAAAYYQFADTLETALARISPASAG